MRNFIFGIIFIAPFTLALSQEGSPSWWLEKRSGSQSVDPLIWTGQQDSVSWPFIPCSRTISAPIIFSDKEYGEGLELAGWVLSSAGIAVDEPIANHSELKRWVVLVNGTCNKIEETNGYINILLADALRRAILFRLSQALVRAPQAHQEIALIFDTITPSQITVFDLLVRMKKEGVGLADIELKKPSFTSPSLMHALIEMGVPEESVTRLVFNFTLPKASELIQSPDALLLAARLSFTDLFHKHLSQSLKYLRHGGSLTEAEIGDKQAFLAILSKSSIPPDTISRDGLMTVLELHKNSSEVGKLFRAVSFN